MFYAKFVSFVIFLLLIFNPQLIAEEVYNTNSIDLQAIETTQEPKYPDYAKMYVGEDKYEKFNRKMFNLNSKLNKFVARPVHVIWSSIMPKFGMDRIRDAYNNIEYPKRLASCILQRDGKGIKTETLRFLTNTTIGLGGLFDPADKIFKIKPTNENMEQALCKCKMNSGSYLVMPCLHACTPRSLCGRAIEAALDPAVYLASPITSLVKFGLMLNRTSYMQPLAKMIESTYADPYDIQKKLYGIENYIRNSNYDREDLVRAEKQLADEGRSDLAEELIADMGEDESFNTKPILPESNTLSDILPLGGDGIKSITNNTVEPDIVLNGYKSQTPVIDSMKTAFFDSPDINKSFWNELSIWNRSFAKRIKTGTVQVTEGRAPYHFKYILQKDKTSPLVILYPSIGEGAGTHHSVVFGKMFYDEGYSVVMQGSHFNWEFAKSMPEGFAPGIPAEDAKYISDVSGKILEYLKNKYGCEFREKTILGTSFGAMVSLFVAKNESVEDTLGINKYIAVSPPIELKYALEQLDKNSEEFDKNSPEVKNKTALTAAKILQLLELKKDKNFSIDTLPFTDEEGKLITTFILRQKLSDLIFTIENIPTNKKTDVYNMINNTSYRDYAEKYLQINDFNNPESETLKEKASLYALSDYLKNNNNYEIYHSLDDYFVNKDQIAKLKTIVGKHLTCLNCGAHLGFLYRQEFLADLKSKIIQVPTN